jgi:hypothetical protein
VEPNEVAETVEKHGRLMVGDQGELMVELPDETAAHVLSEALSDRFGNQVLLSP